jgi:hypothetical protein
VTTWWRDQVELACCQPVLKIAGKKQQQDESADVLLQVPGVLTVAEAQRFIDAAESAGFEHQGSRGPAYGEAFRWVQSWKPWCASQC